MVSVTIECTINDPAKRDEVIALMADINKQNPSGKHGCIIHDWYVNVWDPNRIRLYTEYESYEAADAAERKPAFTKLGDKLFEYQEAGVLTMDLANHRRYQLDNPLPPMHGRG